MANTPFQTAAFRTYIKALALLRESIEGKQLATRNAMMITLLLIAFENMQGNYTSAQPTRNSSLQMFMNVENEFCPPGFKRLLTRVRNSFGSGEASWNLRYS
jgi:hypothetical protein